MAPHHRDEQAEPAHHADPNPRRPAAGTGRPGSRNHVKADNNHHHKGTVNTPRPAPGAHPEGRVPRGDRPLGINNDLHGRATHRNRAAGHHNDRSKATNPMNYPPATFPRSMNRKHPNPAC